MIQKKRPGQKLSITKAHRQHTFERYSISFVELNTFGRKYFRKAFVYHCKCGEEKVFYREVTDLDIVSTSYKSPIITDDKN